MSCRRHAMEAQMLDRSLLSPENHRRRVPVRFKLTLTPNSRCRDMCASLGLAPTGLRLAPIGHRALGELNPELGIRGCKERIPTSSTADFFVCLSQDTPIVLWWTSPN